MNGASHFKSYHYLNCYNSYIPVFESVYYEIHA